MIKYLFFFFLSVGIFANDKVEIYAINMDSQNNIVTASGEVAVVYKDYYISAKKAVYDRATGDLKLYENVRAFQKNKYFFFFLMECKWILPK